MADYSEFPTTPTAWQEQALRDEGWPEVAPLGTEEPPPVHRRRVDVVALAFGVAFVVLALTLMSGVQLSVALFRDGGVLWAVLIAAGVVLLAKELRRARQR